MKYLFILVIMNIVPIGSWVLAQDPVDSTAVIPAASPIPAPTEQEVINVENLYKTNPDPQPIVPQDAAISQQEQNKKIEIKNNVEVQNSKMKSLADLNKLAPFSDISVIQKKFLPKTGRFQLFAAGGMTTNSPWFINLGLKLNFGYHFTESFGIESSGVVLSSSEGQSAKEIRSNLNLQPDKFVNTKYSMGVDLIWSPIYGKITNLQNEIIPFDMYFALGAAMLGTNSQEKSVPALHIGTGQIFALSKSTAFRWDYSWSIYQATPLADINSTGTPSKSTFHDLIFTAGLSFFFPEVNYR